MTMIEVNEYGDYDKLFLKALLYSPKSYSKDVLLEEFLKKENLTSNVGVSNPKEVSKKFIEFLESKGFTKLKTQEVHFSD